MFGAILDRRHAAMIEHELHVGAEIGERDRMADLMRQHAEIERPAAALEARDIGAEGRRFAERIRRLMEDAAKALDERIGELALEKGGKIGVLRTAGADRAAQQAPGSAASCFDMARLGFDIGLGDIDLHMQAPR